MVNLFLFNRLGMYAPKRFSLVLLSYSCPLIYCTSNLEHVYDTNGLATVAWRQSPFAIGKVYGDLKM